MIKRLFTFSLKLTYTPSHTFIIQKMFKKRQKQRQRLREQRLRRAQSRAQTYSYSENGEQEKEEKQSFQGQPSYDFFTRKRQMELNRDFRKLKEQSQFIPQEVGKGGFDEAVYWCQNAKTLQQIVQMIKVFNRLEIPQKIQDQFRFTQFIANSIQHIYLSRSFSEILEFCWFGWKFQIEDEYYWKKIEQKIERMNPSTEEQIKVCLDIAFYMSKCLKGEVIYSRLMTLFKKIDLGEEQVVKLLSIYYNLKQGNKQWIQTLLQKLQTNMSNLSKDIFMELIPIFRELKTISKSLEEKFIEKTQEFVDFYNYRELCKVSLFVGSERGSVNFWKKLQSNAEKQIQNKKMTVPIVFITITQLLPSYKISLNFIRKYVLPEIRKDKFQFLSEITPSSLSLLSKVLYIYELEKETKDIEEIIESKIIKIFHDLKNIQIEELICVIRDYTVTRNGSRQIYVFLEEVVTAKLEQIQENRTHLEMLYAIYEKSQLCSLELLNKLEFYL